MTAHLTALDPGLATLGGTVSVWCGRAGSSRPAYARLPDTPHYAASTMKVAVLAALYRAAEAGEVDLEAGVPVINDFESALPGAPRYALDPHDDQDDEVWARIGREASLGWLARRMIVRSSNLATNVVLGRIGVDGAGLVLRIVGATGSAVRRGIADAAAREAGIDNVVTARDLAALFGRIAVDAGAVPAGRAGGTGWDGAGSGPDGSHPALAARETCGAMLDVLLAQERYEDLAAGLPPGTRVAHKNGWVTGVRHAAGVVFPDDARPYAIAVCTTVPAAAGLDPCALVARISAAAWADRHDLA